MSTASTAAQHDAPPPSSERSLPTFTPLRDHSRESVKAESSASGSWRQSWASRASDDHEEGLPSANGQSSRSPTRSEEKDNHNDVDAGIPKRTNSRHSGGFLLDTGFHPSQLAKTFLSRPHKAPKDIKGKRKSENGDLLVAKRRTRRQQDEQGSSIGGSPLASEVKQDTDTKERVQQASVDIDSPSRSYRTDGVQGNEPGEPSKTSIPRIPPPNVGFDTDPVQIVNMALSLSQGRRRQASGMRVVSGNSADRGLISAGQASNLRSAGYAGSAGQYLSQQRRTSRNFSPRPKSEPFPEPEPSTVIDHTVVSAWPDERIQKIDDEMAESVYYISPATVARVEKAKAHFELMYNYRRLLPHLPPLQRPGLSSSDPLTDDGSRIYNPLQYVRNRKLRFWERRPIPSEEQGWHDIDQVRAWVDAVIMGHRETRHDPTECVRLPDLSHRKVPEAEETDTMDTESPTASIRRPNDSPAIKPRRPKSDWVTYPGDFLADAFWLEQGLNKTKIEDRDGNKIYASDTQFHFSGWKNRVPVQMPLQQQLTPPLEEEAFKNVSISKPPALPDLPSFTSAARGRKHASRGGRREKIRDSIISIPKSDSGSRDRRKGLLRKEFEISSSSEDSDGESSTRGRKRRSPTRRPKPSPYKSNNDNDEYTMNAPDSEDNTFTSPTGNTSLPTSKRNSIADSSRLAKFISRNGSKPAGSRQRSSRRSDSTRRSLDRQHQPRLSLDDEPRIRTSAEYNTTAPSSPTDVGFPSIAINLSPPPSRSPSPSKKPFQARLNPFHARSSSKIRNGIDTTDFASVYPGGTSRNTSGEADKAESEPTSRGTSPMTRGPSPMTKRGSAVSDDGAQAQRELYRSSTASRVTTKSSRSIELPDHPSKIRGIFKGGRIAEIVGNEVHRVGDFIWKREVPGGHSPRVSTSTASLTSLRGSDSDEDISPANGYALKTPPKAHEARFSSAENEKVNGGPGEKPQYHNPNLPSFTSPFQRDRDQQEARDRDMTSGSSPTETDEADHISRLAATHRTISKSPRLDRLAPPKLVTTSPPSPGRTVNADRQNSYGFGKALDLTRSTSASQKFNTALQTDLRNTPASRSASVKPSASRGNLGQDWNLSGRNSPQPDSNMAVTRRDIARARALLLSSGVKAREIYRRAHASQDPPPKFVRDTIQSSDPTLHSPLPLHIPKKEQHVVAARALMSTLTSQSASFREILDSFANKSMPALHTELQALGDLVDNGLTPRVRIAADQAGELSMKLSTTSTLAVKGLNDAIESALRRRRRGPVRYVRRFGYILIEWTVVGLLWAIWLVVMVVKVVLGTVQGVWKVGRWLLFL